MSITEHEAAQLSPTELLSAGLLSQAVAQLVEIAEFLRDDRASFDIDDLRKVVWPVAGSDPKYANIEFNRNYRGVAVFNESTTNDLRVGFAADAASPVNGNQVFTVSVRSWITIPILTSHVSVGGTDGVAGAVVIGLKHAPTIGGGKF